MIRGEETDRFASRVRDAGLLMEDFLRWLGRDHGSPVQLPSQKASLELVDSLLQISTEAANAFWILTRARMSEPDQLLKMQTDVCRDYTHLCLSFAWQIFSGDAHPAITPDSGDKRFQDPMWTEVPCFDFTKQAYLLTTRWLERFVVEEKNIDERARHKAAFYIRQFCNALSPSNFLLTNPELLRETWESRGENLLRGMRLLAEDLELGTGSVHIRQTEKDAFSVGENLANTPGKVIYENEIMQLIQYEPCTNETFKRPLLIVPPWINKFYILDLTPDKSFIRWCVEKGHTLFVISWVNPDRKLGKKSFEDYAREGIVDAVNIIELTTHESALNAVGYCIGGTLLAATLAYMVTMGDRRIKSATFFATQVDFTHAGDLKFFIDEERLSSLEKDMRKRGFLDGRKMLAAFNMLRSNELVWPYMLNNYIKGKSPPPFDFMFWNSDTTHIPAENHAFYLRECYLKNSLARGEMKLCGISLDLKRVEIPIYNLAARKDHIAPAESVFFGNRCFGGHVDYVLTDSGHIAGVINPPSSNKYRYWRDGPEGSRYDEWLAGAKEYSGSWWTDWQTWIERQDGNRVPARPVRGCGIGSMEDAPGSYVKVRYAINVEEDQCESARDLENEKLCAER